MKNKILLPILLIAAMTMVGCNKPAQKSSEVGPGPGTSEVQPGSSDEQPASSDTQPTTSEDPIVYGVAINNKAALQGEWYKGTTRDLDVALTPAANVLQELNKGNLTVTSSDPTIVAVTGLGLNALKMGRATITVKYHDATDTVEVNILSNSAKDKYGVAHEGTADDPFTNEDALAVAKSEKYEQEVYYVRGIVDRFYYAPGTNANNGTAFYLKAAQEGGEQFEIFKCFKEDGSQLSNDDIWVGGEATVYGAFTKYNNQYETSSAKFVSCTGEKPADPIIIEKTFAQVLELGLALRDGESTYDYYKFQGYVTKRDGNNYYLTATKGEALVEATSDEAHGSRTYYSNGIELYGVGKVADIAAICLEGAKLEVTMIVKNYHGTVENGNTLTKDDVVLKEAGTQWAVPEPAVANATLAEFIAGENTKAKAYNVTATIKYWKQEGANKDKYGNMVITDGTNDLVIYGASATASALAWDNAGAYNFTNPQDFLTNEVTAALVLGSEITMKMIRADYNGTKQGTGIITDVKAVTATGIELDQSEAEVEVGSKVQLTASILPAGATGTVTWESSAESVATVDENGKVTGVAAGNATITAKLGDFTATCAVTVVAATPKTGFVLFEDDIVEGDYIIHYSGKNMKASIASNRLEYSEGTPENGLFPLDSAANIVWHIAKNGSNDNYTIYNADANKYAASTGTKNQAALVDSVTDKATWTIAKQSDGTFEIQNVANAAASINSYLRNNGTYGFATYGSSTGGTLSLYKKTGGETPVENEAMPWYLEGTGSQVNRIEGAGVWTWVNYGTMGYADYNEFVAAKDNFVASYVSTPETTIRIDAVSDDIAASKICRVYLVLGAAYNTGVLTLTIPGKDGKTYEGTLEFNDGVLAKANGEAVATPIALPTGSYHGVAKLSAAAGGGLQPVDFYLAEGAVEFRLNGGEMITVSSKTWDGLQKVLVIETPADKLGTVTLAYSEDNNSLTVTNATGALAAYLDSSTPVVLSGNALFYDCDGETTELQAQFNRRYYRSGVDANWADDTGNADRLTKYTDDAVVGSSMRVRPISAGANNRVAINLKNDLSEAKAVRVLSFWVYNSGEADVTLRCWGYKAVNRGSNFEYQANGSAVAKAGQWTYLSFSYYNSSSQLVVQNIYNFQIADMNSTQGEVLYFDNICLY